MENFRLFFKFQAVLVITILATNISASDQEESLKNFQTLLRESQTTFIPLSNVPNNYIRDNEINRFKRSEPTENNLQLDAIHSLSQHELLQWKAKIMKQNMDESVNPCDDFYSYACGNWAKFNKIKEDNVASNEYVNLGDAIDVVTKKLLISDDKKEAAGRNRTNSAENKAKIYFQSCMDYESFEKLGVKPLMELLNTFGGWPLLNSSWNDKNFDWLNLTATMKQYSNDILIVEAVEIDLLNPDENFIHFDQTTLGLPTRDYFLNTSNQKYLNAYRNFMIEVITLLGAESADDRADEILEFETKLAGITSERKNRQKVSDLYLKMSLRNLQEDVPEIDWMRFLRIVQEREIDPEEKVIVLAMGYMKRLVKLVNVTQPATLANYLIWRFVYNLVDKLDNKFLQAKQNLYLEFYGREKIPPRWKSCVAQVRKHMGIATSSLFVRKYFNESSKLDVNEMVRGMRKSFRQILNETDWIDSKTKLSAQKKLNTMSLKIGYPEFILSQNALDAIYAELHHHPKHYFENTLNCLRFQNRLVQKKALKPVNKSSWYIEPAVVNAIYMRSWNEITFPAGILQPPFYHRLFPKNLNYGSIGVVIGHEITHGFDDKGRLFDHDGHPNNWWSEFSKNHFEDKTECFIEQFSNYTLKDIEQTIDGSKTLGENIADSGGINQAYRAYKQWLESQEDPIVLQNEILPDLNLTMTQLFFLSFGQTWCGEIRQDANRNKIKTETHSPGRFRVIGALSNFKEFSEEFHCPVGSPMNSKTKCKVW